LQADLGRYAEGAVAGKRGQLLGWSLAILVLLGGVWALRSGFWRDETADVGAAGGRADEEVIIIGEDDDLDDHPESFYGKTVAIRGEVESVLAPQIFMLDSDGAVGQDQVMVYAPTLDRTLVPNQKIEVRGSVERLGLADLQRLSRVDLRGAVIGELDAIPIIVAESVKDTGEARETLP
jgi:hypothetical protein